MSALRSWCAVAAAAATMTGTSWSRTLYVSPEGNDGWSGRLERPAPDRDDGPLATLTGARNAVRRIKAAGPLTEPVTILFREGRYMLTEPIRFASEDSGTAECPITYAAYPSEHPVFSCGVMLSNLRVTPGGWQCDLPRVREGNWFFRSLYVNGRRATRARTPNRGSYYHIAAKAPPLTDPETGKPVDRDYTAFVYSDREIQDWPNRDDVDIVIYDAWDTSILPIESLDTDNRIVSFRAPGIWKMTTWDTRYYVEHAPDALDEPGEWLLNRSTGTLTYLPRPDETPETVEIVAPVLNQALLLQGDRSAERVVEHVHFDGLTITHTDWHPDIAFEGRAGAVKPYTLTDEPVGYRGVQAAFQVPGAIELRDTRHCAFRNCDVSLTGGYAIVLDDGAKDTTIFRCHLHHLGAGGVRIGNQFTRTGTLLAERNTVDNCFIHYGGRVYRSAVGVLIMRSSYNTVTHNEISDFTYTAVSVGWDWGYSPSSAHDNTIANNHLHRIGRGHLSDMGGIYTLGVSPGTVLRNNLIHDLKCFKYGATGLYQDQASSEILLENNICYDCQTGGYTLGYGKNNRVLNNIFAFGTSHQISIGRHEEHKQLTFQNNVILYRDGNLTGHQWVKGNMDANRNLYWDASGEPVKWGSMTLEQWREQTGNDTDSVVADPRFANPRNGDFSLPQDSPARDIGFKPIDTSKVGLYGDAAWTSMPEKAEILPMEPVPPPRQLSDGYEETAAGNLPAHVKVHGEIPGAGIRVTDRLAADGSHCLEFTDSPDVKEGYNPHMTFDTQIRQGIVTCALDLRREPDAKIACEWRDWFGGPIRTGPRFTVDDNGTLAAGGKDLATIPLETWVHIELRCVLGEQRDGTFDLTLTIPGQKPQTWSELPCGYSKFAKMNWFGIISDATVRTRFQVDNLTLSVRPDAR